jgi:hypothetical protein
MVVIFVFTLPMHLSGLLLRIRSNCIWLVSKNVFHSEFLQKKKSPHVGPRGVPSVQNEISLTMFSKPFVSLHTSLFKI